MLLALAKAVANATATLVLRAKNVAGKCDNQGDKNAVIGSATQCALAASQLVACTKVVAPTIANPECQEQLVEAAKQVSKSVDVIVDTAQVGLYLTYLQVIVILVFKLDFMLCDVILGASHQHFFWNSFVVYAVKNIWLLKN